MNRDERIQENTGLVHTCARRFKGRGIEYDDLFQAGCLGLIKAAERFDESRGLCFSTYAVPMEYDKGNDRKSLKIRDF